MPCETHTPREQANIAYKELNTVTRLLCGLCERIEAETIPEAGVPYEFTPPIIEADPVLAAWWAEHKVLDRLKAEREEANQEAEEKREESA